MNKMVFLVFTILCVFLPKAIAKKQKIICPSFDEKCFVNRYSNLELPKINPEKVGYTRTIQLPPGIERKMVTLALKPPLFEISNFLSNEETEHLINLAKKEGLVVSKTIEDGVESEQMCLGNNSSSIFKQYDFNGDRQLDINEMLRYLETSFDFNGKPENIFQMYKELSMDKDENAVLNYEEFQSRNITTMALLVQRIKGAAPETRSRYSNQAWINSESWRTDRIINNIQLRVQSLTKLPLEMIQASEHMQVVSYERKGHYNCHLDSEFPVAEKKCCHLLHSGLDNCRICRYLTVLYFLNDVVEGGETAFPLADNSTFNEQVWIRDEGNTCNLAKNCRKSNVIVKPEKGKAVVWYNHEVDNKTKWMGNLDHFSFHGGCEVRRGTKWIANNWISVGNDRLEDIWNWAALAQHSEAEYDKDKNAQNEMKSATIQNKHNEL